MVPYLRNILLQKVVSCSLWSAVCCSEQITSQDISNESETVMRFSFIRSSNVLGKCTELLEEHSRGGCYAL